MSGGGYAVHMYTPVNLVSYACLQCDVIDFTSNHYMRCVRCGSYRTKRLREPDCDTMTHTRTPRPLPPAFCGSVANSAAGSSQPAAVLSFIGTAAHHLARTERAIQRQRAVHGPVADLLKRRRILVARCAALGASDD